MADVPVPLYDALLARWPCARLAIGVPSQVPWMGPVVFAPDARGVLWTPVDGKRKRGRRLARLEHVAREGRATLLLDAYEDDWAALWWVRVRVGAAVVLLEGDPETHPGVRALRAKYPQYARTPLVTDPPTLIEMTPRAVSGWAAAGWTGLAARFAAGP